MREFESLRGVAIALVFLFHLDGFMLGLEPRDLSVVSPAFAFIAAGHTGVSLFFILSGFLLALPFLEEAWGGKRVVRGEYLARRALRILPLYYAAVAVGTVLSVGRPADIVRGVPYLFFLNAFPKLTVPLAPFSNVWWSLATEVHFYLVLPLLPLVLRSGLGRRVGVALLAGWTIVYALFLLDVPHLLPGHRHLLALSLFGRLPFFLAGILAAAVYASAGERIRDRWNAVPWFRNGGADLVLLAVLAALGIMLRWVVLIGYTSSETTALHAWHLPEGILWTVILLLVLLAPLRTKPLIHNRVFATLGILSYSIYVVHVPLIVFTLRAIRQRGYPFAGWNATTLAGGAGVALACVLIASVTYRLIERPFLVRKARLDR